MTSKEEVGILTVLTCTDKDVSKDDFVNGIGIFDTVAIQDDVVDMLYENVDRVNYAYVVHEVDYLRDIIIVDEEEVDVRRNKRIFLNYVVV